MREEQSKRNYKLEALEPRVLLSADGLSAGVTAVDSHGSHQARIDIVLELDEENSSNEIDPLFDDHGITLPSIASDLTAVETEALEEFDDDSGQVESQIDSQPLDERDAGLEESDRDQDLSTSEESGEVRLASDYNVQNFAADNDFVTTSDAGILDLRTTQAGGIESNPMALILVETLNVANGPPIERLDVSTSSHFFLNKNQDTTDFLDGNSSINGNTHDVVIGELCAQLQKHSYPRTITKMGGGDKSVTIGSDTSSKVAQIDENLTINLAINLTQG